MVQPSGAIGAEAVSTSWPWIFLVPCSDSGVCAAIAGLRRLHLRSFDMSVLRSTRLMSGCAIRRPCAPTT